MGKMFDFRKNQYFLFSVLSTHFDLKASNYTMFATENFLEASSFHLEFKIHLVHSKSCVSAINFKTQKSR